MDRSTGSIVTRRIAGVLALALCAAGCGGNSYVAISSGAPATGVSAGTTGYVQASTSSTSTAAWYIFLLHWSLLNRQWDQEAGIYGSSTLPAPPMDETRTVNMQDCTTPIVDWAANLRCR